MNQIEQTTDEILQEILEELKRHGESLKIMEGLMLADADRRKQKNSGDLLGRPV